LACGTNPAAIREEKNELGLRAGHAYSILDSIELKTENGMVRIIQIRNPWAYHS